MEKIFNIKWLYNISIAKKLYFVVGIMAFLLMIELGALFFSIHTLSAVRAFVGGEGLWSKSQKNAIYSLEKFANTRDYQDYTDFQNFMKVQSGDHNARVELLKENPDLKVVYEGFINGRNNPEDIDGMIKLIRRFHNISYIQKALTIWSQADQEAKKLMLISQHLQVEIIVGKNKTDSLLKEIDPINQRLTQLEDDFSYTLGEGARWLENLILKLLFFITLTVELSVLILAFYISRGITKGLNEINLTTLKITQGDLSQRVNVFSKDEIGEVATSINYMAEQLQKEIEIVKLSKEQIKDSENQIQTIFNEAPDAIIVFETDGNVVRWNAKAEIVFGWRANEIIGKPLHEFIIPKQYKEEQSKGMKHFLKIGDGLAFVKAIEIEVINKKGVKFFVSISISPVKMKGKDLFIGFVRDVSDRKKDEEKVKKSEEKFNKAFQLSPSGITLTSLTTGRFIDANESFLKMTGYQQDEVIGHAFHELKILDDVEREKLLDEINKSDSVINKEIVFRKKSGETGVSLFSSEKISMNEEEVILTILYEITDRKKAEFELKKISEDLMRSNKELEQFAYIASHDLQEPLRTISNYIGLLDEKYKEKSDEETNEFSGYIVEASTRMKTLISDLLEYSRVGTNSAISEIDCNKLLQEVLKDLNLDIQESGAKINSEKLPVINGYVYLKSLFQNLLSNAIKFRKNDIHPIINITVQDKNTEWLFGIKDNGIGIEKNYYDRIFVIFQRLHTRVEYPGTGMGLAYCKKIVELHKGKIWVESEFGKGSTFYFTIPKVPSSKFALITQQKEK